MAGSLNRDVVLNLLMKTSSMEASAKRASQQLDGMNKRFDGLIGGAKKLAAVAGVAFGAQQLTRFVGDAIGAATDLGESVNAVQVVFGSASEKVLAFGADTSDAVFVANAQMNELATVTGALLTGVGFSMDEAAEKTINLSQRAGDMASVFNTEVPDAVAAINSALRGESEPIRRYGVLLDEASVKAKALELGIVGVGDTLTQQDKVVARYALIMEQTSKYQGDAANTADSLANKMRALNEKWTNAKASLGEAFLPAAEALVDVMDNLVPLIETAAPVIKRMVDEMVKLVRPVQILVDLLPDFGDASDQSSSRLGNLAGTVGRFLGNTVDALPVIGGFTSSMQLFKSATDLAVGAVEGTNDPLQNMVKNMDARNAALYESEPAFQAANSALSHHDQLIGNDIRQYEDSTQAIEDNIEAHRNLADELRQLADPALRAMRSMDRYADALMRAQEDGKITAVEARDLAEAWLDASADLDQVSRPQYEAAMDAMAQATGLPRAELDKLLGTFNELEGEKSTTYYVKTAGDRADIDRWNRMAEWFMSNPNPTVTVNVQATGDTDLIRALTTAERRGAR